MNLKILGDENNWYINKYISHLKRKTRFWNNLHQVHTILKYWKAQEFKKCFGVIKPKGLNRIAKIGNGHLCLG